ncbi:MAG: hypothetical protein IPJ07_00920 [Acidobacteria bacterium]|nr:hypothetical protein [Acidobacteriota bacterium]
MKKLFDAEVNPETVLSGDSVNIRQVSGFTKLHRPDKQDNQTSNQIGETGGNISK